VGVVGESDGAAAPAASAAAEESKVGGGDAPPAAAAPAVAAAPAPAPRPAKKAAEKKSNIFDRLTDTKLYTGAHKARFDADGRGRGKAGRDDIATTDQLSKLVRGGGGGGGTMGPSGPPVREVSPERKVAAAPAPAKKKKPAAEKKGSIFDRLTDTSLYTGAHKARFGADGKGRGLQGRDGGINQNPTASLANLTRR